MSLPNMKTFCLAAVKPLIRSVKDFYNAKTEQIVTVQKAHDDSITSILENTEQLANTVTDIDGRVTQLRSDLDNATDIPSFEGYREQINSNTSAIDILNTKYVELKTTVNSLVTDMATVKRQITALQQSVEAAVNTANKASVDVEDLASSIYGGEFSPTPDRDGGMWQDDDYTPGVNEYNKAE